MVEALVFRLRALRRRQATRISPGALAHAAAWTALLGVAALLAWRDPGANLFPALALAIALMLDGGGRLAARRIAARAGPDPRLSGLPSLVLGIGGAVGLLAGIAALLLFALLFPRSAPVLASALAGLIAIGAFARLALIRIVLALPEDEAAARHGTRP